MVYNTQDCSVFGLCPSSGILVTRKHNISESVSVSVLKWRGGGETPTLLCPLERSNFYHGTKHVRVRVRVALRLAVYRQSVRLGDRPLDKTNNFFQLNPCGHSPSILSDELMGLSFTSAAGPLQRSHSRVRVLRDSRPYFTVSDSRFPQPGGSGPHIYIHHEQGGPVIPKALGSIHISTTTAIWMPETKLSPRERTGNYAAIKVLIKYA
jgi:hypothetical protein